MTADGAGLRAGAPRIGLVSSATDLGVMVVRSLLIKLLREKHPRARILVLAEKGSIAWLREFYEIHSYVDACVALATEQPAGPWETLRLWRQLRAQRLDVLILSPAARFPVQLARRCGIPMRVGLPRDGAAAEHLTHRAAVEGPVDRDLHWTRVLSAYARALDLDFRGARAHVPFVRVEGGRTPGGRRPRVVVHAGGNAQWNRRWPRRRFARLCQLLVREERASVTLIGGRDETLDNAAIAEAVGRRAIEEGQLVDASEMPIAETARMILDADLFVGNDSGPMNLAVALGTPVVAVRGADPENFRADAVDPAHTVISNWERCSRRETGDETCRHGCPVAYDRAGQVYPRCMEEIPFERVWSAVGAALRGRAAGEPAAATHAG